MAEKKNRKKNTAPAAKKNASSETKKKNNGDSSKTKNEKKPAESTPAVKTPTGLAAQLIPYILLVAAIAYAICLFSAGAGLLGGGLRSLSFGLFGGAAYTIPLYLLLAAFMWRMDRENGILAWKGICYGITFLISSIMMHFFAGGAATFSPIEHFRSGMERIGGGAVGGLLGEVLMKCFGQVLSLLLLFALLFVFALLIFGITPRGLWVMIAYKIKMSRERARAFEGLEVEEKEKALRKKPARPEVPTRAAAAIGQQPLVVYEEPHELKRKKKSFNVDVNVEEDYEQAAEELLDEIPASQTEPEPELPADEAEEAAIDEKIFEEVMRRTREKLIHSGANPDEALTDPQPAADIRPEETAEEEDDLPWEETVPAQPQTQPETEEELDLSAIFAESCDNELLRRLSEAEKPASEQTGEDAEMELELHVEHRKVTEVYTPKTVSGFVPDPPKTPEPQPEPEPEEEYVFPPIDLLQEDDNPQDENAAAELKENAARLVETLRNFNVKTKIVDVCRGPTITRYELAPEPGTKVRSIANLVDDIALNLATSGVRFEPSIPGKSAVGIEVPNKNAATVHLRTLLENPRFSSAKSRLTAALGQDVAGADVFLDVAKMPHLLIAGATGQGKSVCINSLIVSLLYKAKPDELKFIMVDPKKVELNIYNGIPHLYMPVISDPKKAAGALSWAVSEMERRYSLIEEVGVRDLKSYNEITKNDPQYEFLPQFVIIIDELADLMMMAKNDVEAPICRIAQKARAAGMHLIIGTQRPSVDVITGLIKANFPSRISFRVSQLVDSRTIIDRAGAESLVGRDDMLYSPVGSHEPMRVQGSFVSDEEVERVVEFIRQNNGSAEYNSGAIAEVERNAASIGTGTKKGSGADDEEGDAFEDDPMLRPAIELAVEQGKISTSLIQRRLSLGYGRAAKLIDRMEQLGYVSAPDGQKPRDVLISKEQFMEMVLRDTDS